MDSGFMYQERTELDLHCCNFQISSLNLLEKMKMREDKKRDEYSEQERNRAHN